MANPQVSSKPSSTKPSTPNSNSNEPTTSTLSKNRNRFQKIETDRFMYSPSKGCDLPVIGHLVNLVEMPPIKERAWSAFVIKLTEPTKGLGRDKQVHMLTPGQVLLVPATYILKQHLERAALRTQEVYEVSLQPLEKVDIGGGQTLWRYELGVNPTPSARKEFGASALLEQRYAALPAASPEIAEEPLV